MPPKWSLPDHDGVPMVRRALEGIDLADHRIVVTVLREHDNQIGAVNGIRSALGDRAEVVVLDAPTRSQSETVALTLASLNYSGPFLIKDSDNSFALEDPLQPYNYVCVDSLNRHDNVNPRNKSYVEVDRQGIVVNIREKEVVSDLFSVGGYFFADANQYLTTYNELQALSNPAHPELYVSDVIAKMIFDDHTFKARQVSSYHDWGTVHEWRNELEHRQTLLFALDGLIFERGSKYFRPRFDEVSANDRVVAVVKDALDRGDSVIALSIRSEELEGLTREQLRSVGLDELRVIYGCPVGTWRLLTARHGTLPVPSGHFSEIALEDPFLEERILER